MTAVWPAPLDGVALFVQLTIEGGRSSSRPAAPHAVGDLVGGLRDHRAHPASAQVVADGPRGVGLIREHRDRTHPGTPEWARHPQRRYDVREVRCVRGLAGREQKHYRPTPTVGGQVDLRGQSAARAPEGVLERLAADARPFLRAPAACWCARTIVESTATTQSSSPRASACAINAVNTRCQVPSMAQLRSLVYTPFHEPYSGGRQRHCAPLWYFHAIASITSR